MTQKYQLVFKAEGEVRDADGNLISSSEELQGQTVLTAEQAETLVAALSAHNDDEDGAA